MYVTITDFIESASTPTANRLTLTKDNVLRLPRTVGKIRVLSGCAWVSMAGRDHIVHKGESLSLPMGKDTPVITAVGNGPLVLEVARR